MIIYRKIIIRILDVFRNISEFGIKISFVYEIYRYLNRFIFVRKLRHKVIVDYLKRNYLPIIEKYRNCNNSSNCILQHDSPIWVFWLQGIENSPVIVQKCVNMIINNSAEHPVIILDKRNLSDFVSLPTWIFDKVDKGLMTYTHFSDILRMALITQRGGIWMDATLFITSPLHIEGECFWTIKQNKVPDFKYVSQYRWTGFCMGAGKGNLLTSFSLEMLLAYNRDKDTLIDYLLLDYIIELGYLELPSIRSFIDNISFSNPNLYYLQNNIHHNYCENEFREVKNNTYIFKLNRRITSSENPNSYFNRLFLS